jgi:hypothetical protein
VLQRRAVALVESDPLLREMAGELAPGLVAGSAAFPGDGDDLPALLGRCRERMDEERKSLLRKLDLSPLGFWESLERLLREDRPLLEAEALGGRGGAGLVWAVQQEAAREMLRDPGARGLLLLGTGRYEVNPELPAVKLLASHDLAGRMLILGKRGSTLASHPSISPVFVDGDERLAKHELVFFLSEHATYGAAVRADGRFFHTSDAPLVHHLAAKLQESYDLR